MQVVYNSHCAEVEVKLQEMMMNGYASSCFLSDMKGVAAAEWVAVGTAIVVLVVVRWLAG